jgi:hypothetical protein
MFDPQDNTDSAGWMPTGIARKAAAFFALVYLIGFLMYVEHPAYGKLFVLTTIVTFVALLVFAFLPRQAYAAGGVRTGAVGLSVLSIVLGAVKIMGALWDTSGTVMGLIVIALLVLMAHEALTWE